MLQNYEKQKLPLHVKKSLKILDASFRKNFNHGRSGDIDRFKPTFELIRDSIADLPIKDCLVDVSRNRDRVDVMFVVGTEWLISVAKNVDLPQTDELHDQFMYSVRRNQELVEINHRPHQEAVNVITNFIRGIETI